MGNFSRLSAILLACLAIAAGLSGGAQAQVGPGGGAIYTYCYSGSGTLTAPSSWVGCTNPSGGGGAAATNITQWNSVALGSPSAYGTSPGAVTVPGVNSFVTNTVTVTGAGGTFPVAGTTSNAGSAVATSSTNIPGVAYNYGFNGTTWDQLQVDGSKYLKVNCSAGCAASGVADEAAFTAGTSTYGPVGGFFQTTATANALTNGQGGWWQMTANRAGFVNVRNSSGTELGVTANPFVTAGAGTAGSAAGGVLTVQGVASMTPVQVSQATASSLNATVVGTGTFATQSAITAASGSIASGAIASGAVASGAIASGAIASGAFAAGSFINATAGDPCMFQAKTNVAISTATGTTALVTGVSAKKIYVCSLVLVAPSAVSVSLSEGSSSTCGTSAQAAVMGVATSGTAANGLPLAANGGLTLGNGGGTVAATATNANYLCLFQSGTAQIAGNLTYVQQ